MQNSPLEQDETMTPVAPQATALVIEGEPGGAILASVMLHLGGYQVTTVDSAASACDSLQLGLPDLVLLDLHLPDHDGLALARQIRAIPATADLPLVALTAPSDPSDRTDAGANGFDACLAKPFSRVRLLDAASQARKRRRDLRA